MINSITLFMIFFDSIELTAYLPINPTSVTDPRSPYEQLGPYDEAITDYTRAIEPNPEHARAIAERGFTYRLAGRYAEALAVLGRVIGQDDYRDWAQYERFLVLGCRGDRDGAAVDLAAVTRMVSERLATDKARDDDLYNLALCRAASGDVDQALADLAGAIERFPNLELVREALDELRDLGGVPGVRSVRISPRCRATLSGAAEEGYEDGVGALAVRPELGEQRVSGWGAGDAGEQRGGVQDVHAGGGGDYFGDHVGGLGRDRRAGDVGDYATGADGGEGRAEQGALEGG
jgi:tetratricopeptide (TPR) repeat protein